MDLSQTIDNRINQLIQHDNNANDVLNMLNNSTIGLIEQYLTAFFNRYAVDNQLTTSQASAMINSWDKNQFEQLLSNLNIHKMSSDAQQRAKVLGVKAGMNHGAMLNAIIGLGIVYLADKQINLINNHEVSTIQSQLTHISKVTPKMKNISKLIFSKLNNARNDGVDSIRNAIGLNGKHYNTGVNVHKGKSAITQDDTTKIWSDNLWNKSDIMANDVENMVNQHIRHGMSLQDLHDMLASHNNQNQFNPNQSISDRVKQSEFNARRIIRTETSRLVNQVNQTTYSMSGVKKVGLHYEPSACDKCIDLANQGPWDIDDAPSIPDDTHPNCYCYLTNEDDDSDDLTTNPNDYNK